MSQQKIRVAINGFGRIGRAFFKVALEKPELEVVAVNDLTSIENIAYLLKYDTAYGTSAFDVKVKSPTMLSVAGKDVLYVSERDATKLPWGANDIDLVVESTGLFTEFAKAKVHLDAGAKRVVITAPTKDEPMADIASGTFLLGVNEDKIGSCKITSNASCTTNAASPLIAILHEAIGIDKALLNTTHGYTASQALVDGPSKKDFREGRAAAMNLVPSSTGAAIAVTKVIPELKGKFDGISVRVPVVTGSIVDITFIAKRETTKDEVNAILKKAAGEARWAKSFSVTEEQLVSSDIIGSKYASIADLNFTRVIGNLVKVLAWYDNEMGYTHALVEHAIMLGKGI